MFEDDDNLPNPQQLPLYRKGLEIFDLTHKIVDLVEDGNPVLMHIKAMMMEDASLLTVKVAGAEAADLYDLRMENATLIRKAARELITHCRSLEMYGFQELHYLHLIREAIEEYRQLFVIWVRGFDPWNYVNDSWGLFNPPGVDVEEDDSEE